MEMHSRTTEETIPPQDVPESEAPGHSVPVTAATGPGLQAGKADLTKRIVAGVIDAVVAVVVGLIPIIGGIVAAAYWLVRDGLDLEFMDHRSLGKKVMGLRPVTVDGSSMDIGTSVKRNWMFALGGLVSLLLFIPVIGWLLMIPVALVSLGLGLYEFFRVVTDPQGRRWGDSLAGTKVIETDEEAVLKL